MRIIAPLVAITLSFCTNVVSSNDGEMPPTPEMKAAAEKVIKVCETKYQQIAQKKGMLFGELDKRIQGIKKPGPLSLPATKRAYATKVNDLQMLKKAFDQNFMEFTRFVNDKIKVRTQKTARKMSEASAEFSSNCSRFAEGLSNYPDWALNGKAARGFDRIFDQWVKDARMN